MSCLDRDRFHRAARDGYLDLLRDATRKDCNTSDEDGMTPTLWAAYYGNLDALRLIVGRGGNPDRCDHFGNTALHWACANGHMNCVSFLVNFGVSLWALDNDFHTASNVAAINQRDEILRYLDDVVARQSALNKKLVQKLKEKSVLEAEKRIKLYQKLQRKAAKKAEKEEKEIEKQRKKIYSTEFQLNGVNKTSSLTIASLKRDARITYASPKYSDIISTGAGTTKKGLGAVSKRVQQKKQTIVVTAADFKVRESEVNGKRSVRSLSGLLRDSEVLYVPKFDTQSTTSGQQSHHRRHMKDVFDNKSELSRAISEPDFLHTTDSGFGDEIVQVEPSSIFERPGFGSVAFRNSMSGTLMSLPSTSTEENDDGGCEDLDSTLASEKDSDPHNGSVEDSIGSAGSLAQRNHHLPWDDDEGHFDEEEGMEASPLVVFLVAHGLMEYVTALVKEKIDLEALMLLTEEDLKILGLPLGPRRKLAKAIDSRKLAIDSPGDLLDSRL